MANKKKSKGASITAEFGHKDAKGGGAGGIRIPEGDYLAKILEIKPKEATTGSQMLVCTYKIIEGKYKGKKIRDNLVLVPKALFRLRNMLEALGVTVPEKTVKVKYEQYVGEEIGLTIVDGEEYKNKIRSEVGDFIPADTVNADEDDDDDEDEDVEDDDEDDDDEDEDLDEVDLDEL